jgi:hypothetical protein
MLGTFQLTTLDSQISRQAADHKTAHSNYQENGKKESYVKQFKQ